jgi:hypothetical protein
MRFREPPHRQANIDKQLLAPICQASAVENIRSNFKANHSSELRCTQLQETLTISWSSLIRIAEPRTASCYSKNSSCTSLPLVAFRCSYTKPVNLSLFASSFLPPIPNHIFRPTHHAASPHVAHAQAPTSWVRRHRRHASRIQQ